MNSTSATRSHVPTTCRAAVLCSVVAVFAAGANVARADAFETLERLDQPAFRALSETLGAATHYKGITPAETLGILGFDVGIEVSSTEIDRSLFDTASDGDYAFSSVIVPRLHAHKGLPFGLDVGAYVGTVLDSDLTLMGAEVRYSLLDGGLATPAVAVRASYGLVVGDAPVNVQNGALELTVSKGFLMVTPYGGVGVVFTEASADDTPSLEDESFDQKKLFVGANVNFVGLNLTAEIDRTGDHTTYSGKLGIRF